VPMSKGHHRADRWLYDKGIRRQTSVCMQRQSQGRQVPVCKGYQRADGCLQLKGIKRQTGACVQRQPQGRQVAACKGRQRADECLHAKGNRGQTTAHEQRASQGRQVGGRKGHQSWANQRADNRRTRWLTAFMKRACSSEVHTKRGFLAPLLSPCLSELSSPLPSLQQHNSNNHNNDNNNNNQNINIQMFQLIVLARYSNIMYVMN